MKVYVFIDIPRHGEGGVHLSVSFIFLAIMVRNSGKSMVPFPSASTSLIMSWSSASVGFWPRDLITWRKEVVKEVEEVELVKGW